MKRKSLNNVDYCGILVTEELLIMMYEDIKYIKEELNEIRIALIPEEEPTEEEFRDIELGKKEIAEEKYRPWKEIKKEFYF